MIFRRIPAVLASSAMALTLVACGADVTGDGQGQFSSYSYLLCNNCSNSAGDCETDNSRCGGGCTTGAHSLSSLSQECATLESDSQNNFCDTSTRRDMFQTAGCPGTFSPTY